MSLLRPRHRERDRPRVDKGAGKSTLGTRLIVVWIAGATVAYFLFSTAFFP
jgi:hypothetical protein